MSIFLLFVLLLYCLPKLSLIPYCNAGPDLAVRIIFAILAFVYILVVCWDTFIWPILPDEDLYIMRNLTDLAAGFVYFSLSKLVMQGVAWLLRCFM